MQLSNLIWITIIGIVHGQYPVIIYRPNSERAEIGPGPGCFGVLGPVREVRVPYGQSVQFFDDYGCRGRITYQGSSRNFDYYPVNVNSILIWNDRYY